MITKLTARTRNAYDNSINKELILLFDDTSQYRITRIDGLGPVAADINTVDTALEAGGLFLSTKDGQRNIVLAVEFNPDYGANSTVGALRHELYGVFMPKSFVELVFEVDDMDDGPFTIMGYVETHEPDIFNKEPSVQISVICPKPYFRGTKGIQEAQIEDNSDVALIEYPGNVPVGFELFFAVEYDWAFGFQFTKRPYNVNGNQSFRINDFPMLAGDRFMISSVEDNHYVNYLRSAATQSAFGYFAGSLTETRLEPGLNAFGMTSMDGFTFITVKWEEMYGGL